MATELGIGVRVWVGWCPDSQMRAMSTDPRACTGTIVEGPFDTQPGQLVSTSSGLTEALRAMRFWNVQADGASCPVWAAERLLFPIDDGDPAAEREQADRDEEVEA